MAVNMDDVGAFVLQLNAELAIAGDKLPTLKDPLAAIPTLLLKLQRHKSIFYLVVSFMNCLGKKAAQMMADHKALEVLLAHAAENSNSTSMDSFGTFLRCQATFCIIPPLTSKMYVTLTDAINQKNHIPSEPAEACFLWLAGHDDNHQVVIECGGMEFFLSQLSSKWQSPIGEAYIGTLSSLADRHISALERCGKAGVVTALRMLKLRSPAAASFLLRLVSLASNREIVRTTGNGTDILIAFANKTRDSVALGILDLLATDDEAIRTKMVSELAELLLDAVEKHLLSWEQFHSLVKDVTDGEALDELIHQGVFEAIFSSCKDGIAVREKLQFMAKLSSYDSWGTYFKRFDAMAGFIPYLITIVHNTIGDRIAAEHAVKILANYFASVELADISEHKCNSELLSSILPQLVDFISKSTNLSHAIITLSLVINIARVPFNATALIPLLPIILDHGIHKLSTSDEDKLACGIAGLLLAISKEPGVDLNILLGKKVITVMQLIRSISNFRLFMGPLLNTLYTHHDPTITEHLKKQDLQVLSNFLNKNGAPTPKYIMALLDGDVMQSIFNNLRGDGYLDKETCDALSRLSFLGAKKLLASAPVHILLRRVRPLAALDIIWAISLKRTTRRMLKDSERKLLYDFIIELVVPVIDRITLMLKCAVIFNLESPDDGDSDDDVEKFTSQPSSSTNPPSKSPEERLTLQPNTAAKSAPKKNKKKKRKSKPAVQATVETESTEVIDVLVRTFQALCERASKELLQHRGGEMKDGFENIYLFLRYMNLSCGEVSSIRMDSFTMFIINTWLYGSKKQIVNAMEILSVFWTSAWFRSTNEMFLLNDLAPIVKKYIAGGRGISPLPAAVLSSVAGLLDEWIVLHPSSITPVDNHKLLSMEGLQAKLQEEVKTLRGVIESQKQTISSLTKSEANLNEETKKSNQTIGQLKQAITSLQQTNEKLQQNKQQSDHLISDLIAKVDNLEIEQSKAKEPKDLNSILEMIDVEAIKNLEDCTRFYNQLKAKVKATKQRKTKLQQERQEQEATEKVKAALVCPICQDNKITLTCNPCGHAFCKPCTDTMFPLNGKICPICRKNVKSTITIYL